MVTAAPDIYFGSPGGQIVIPHPRGGVQSTRVRTASTFTTASGGARVGKTLNGKRRYVMSWDRLWYETFAQLQAYDQGHCGPGPFVLHDPAQINWLTVNQSAATSNSFGTDGFTLDSGERDSSDNFTRSATASWGVATSGETWTNTGTASWFSVNGTTGRHVHASTGTEIFSALAGTYTDFDITVTVAASSIASYAETSIYARYTDANNWYRIDNVTSAGQFYIQKRVSGSTTTLTGPITGVTATTSNLKVRLQVSGTTLRAKVWLAASSEPADWMSSTTDSSLASGQLVLGSYDEVAAKTFTWDDLTVTHADTSALSSSATLINRGPRALAWTFVGLPPLNTPIVTLDSPVSEWTGIPVISGQAMVFSLVARGGGSDPIVTLTPKLVWYDSVGAVVSTTSGTPVATSSGAWAALSVTATPPAGAYYVLCKVEATSGVSVGSVVYLDSFQLERGSTVTTWRPGTGVFPVAVISLADQWPWQASTYRESPVLVLQEEGP